MVNVLEKLKLGSPVQSLSLKIDDQGLAIDYMEEDFEVMKLDLLREIVHTDIHLLSRLQRSSAGLNLEDSFLQDVPLKGLFSSGFSWVSPRLHLDLIVIRHLEGPFCRYASNVLEGNVYLAGLGTILDGDLAKVPSKVLQVPLKLINRLVRLFRVVEDLLSLIERAYELLIHGG